VLVADDEPNTRGALADLIIAEPSLELAGVAGDAEEAVTFSHRERPDVVLLDVRMPGGGGPRAARGIRRRSPRTRVVAFSAYGDLSTVAQMLEAGAEGYLVKGASSEEIVHAIHDAAQGRGTVATDLVRHLAQRWPQEEDGDAPGRRRGVSRIRRLLDFEGLAMAFQPIVDLADGSVVGFEALARFTLGPDRPADVWFAEAEAVGLGREAEAAALRSALAHLDRLPLGTYLSVNASPLTAASPFLEGLLADVGERVVVEITEHAPVQDYDVFCDALDGLRARGVRIAVDDAGAGFASLTRILRLMPDFIKLDVVLTRGIDTDDTRRQLASALSSFASGVGAAIIAEGIETKAELDALRELGVPYGQGFLLARPAPLGEGDPPLTHIRLD
jgi:EAL domain-containing protein (putative c-di-GMP-specific phosphodiesterase class I)